MTERESFDVTPENAAEDLDDDRLGVDSLEKGIEPPEKWAEADRFGMTPSEAQEGADLEHRLREERPDDDSSGPVQSVLESENPIRESSSEYSDNADKGAGSVADAIREPEEVQEL